MAIAFGVILLAALAVPKINASVPVMLLPANLAYFGLVALVALHAGRPVLGFLRVRWLCYCGLISYGIYLYHPIVREVVRNLDLRRGEGATAWGTALMLTGTLGVAIASWHLIERPLLSLKDRFGYRRIDAPAVLDAKRAAVEAKAQAHSAAAEVSP